MIIIMTVIIIVVLMMIIMAVLLMIIMMMIIIVYIIKGATSVYLYIDVSVILLSSYATEIDRHVASHTLKRYFFFVIKLNKELRDTYDIP